MTTTETALHLLPIFAVVFEAVAMILFYFITAGTGAFAEVTK